MGKQREYRSILSKRKRIRVVPEWKEKGLPPPDGYIEQKYKAKDYGDVNEEKAVELINAVREADMMTVRRLVRSGAKINCPMEGGWTALHHAAVGGQLEMIRYLMLRGGDNTMFTDDGKLPVDYVDHNCTEIMELLR